MRKLWLLSLIVAGLLLGMAATRWLSLPPPVRDQNAAGEFNAVRAKARLTRVLGPQAPHPADSLASDAIRARLLDEIRRMGLEPRVSDRFACNKLYKSSGVSCARVRNVAVTIGAGIPGPHLLVNSHYDSVPVGPGASDAGMGVAAMLEALALLRDRPLRKPVTFLFNEGEELGLIGARAFLDSDPLSRNVDALINLEARGTTGPVNMFETSVPNAAAVRWYRQSVRNPVANSLAVSAYRLIPNYTDVNTFVEDRPAWTFLNFAPIGNETRYHSPGDDIAALDTATLQHMGDQLLQTAAAMSSGAAASAQSDGGERMFMNIGTRWLFTAPALSPLVAALLLAAALILSVAAVPRGMRRSGALAVTSAVPLLLLVLLVPVAAAWAGLAAVGAMREGQFWRATPLASELAIYAGVIALGLALLAAMKRWPLPQLRRAWWLLFVLIGIGFSIAAPGAMVYFVLPPLIFWGGSLLGRRMPLAETAAALLAAFVLFITLGGALGLVQDLINNGPLWALALLGGIVLMPWLIELRPLLEDWRLSRIVPAAAVLTVLAWAPAAFLPAYSADRQQQWTTQYVLEQGKPPRWSIVNDRKPLPDDFSGIAEWKLGRLDGLGQRLRWIAPAPPQPGFLQPTVERIADVPLPGTLLPNGASPPPPGTRTIRLRIASNGADSIMLVVEREGALTFAGMNNEIRPFAPGTKAPYTLTCTGRSCDGAVATLEARPGPLEVKVIATHWRLPPAAGPLLDRRPANARPQYLPDATILVSRIRV